MRKKLFGVDLPIEREIVETTFSEEDIKEYTRLVELYYDNLLTIGAIQTTLDKTRTDASKEYNQELVDKVVELTHIKDSYIEDNDVTLGLMKEIESRYQTNI